MSELVITSGEVNEINRGNPDNSTWDPDTVHIGKGSGSDMYRGMWRFSLSGLPATRIINSAILTLNQFAPSPIGGLAQLRLATKPWIAGSVFTPSPTTWNHYDTGKLWDKAGGDTMNHLIASAVMESGSLSVPEPIDFDVTMLVAASTSELSMIMQVADEVNDSGGFTHFNSLDLLPTLTIDYTEVESDLLRSGASWLSDKRHAHMTKPIVYAYNGSSLQVRGTPGRSEWEERDSEGNVIFTSESRDWLVKASTLPVVPDAGHRIIDGPLVYEVMSPGGQKPWRFSDINRATYRIHTKLVQGGEN